MPSQRLVPWNRVAPAFFIMIGPAVLAANVPAAGEAPDRFWHDMIFFRAGEVTAIAFEAAGRMGLSPLRRDVGRLWSRCPVGGRAAGAGAALASVSAIRRDGSR